MRKAFAILVVGVVLAIAAYAGWLALQETEVSEAAHFEQSINMVHHQTENITVSLVETNEVVAVNIAEVTDINLLLEQWSPRYQRAQVAYQKFDSSIQAAELRAEAYFASQKALTMRYHDEARKARAKAEDDADYELYSQWQDRAHMARDNALAIIHRLDDMETDLRKLELSTEMSFDASRFNDVPQEIKKLEDELIDFQIASDNIRSITQSPFAVSPG
ncbi:MAG: hypothetical protein OXR67_15120 [Chloroflexota bacterium]|nr:hypothetical protein [Chloroflexota bacterium]